MSDADSVSSTAPPSGLQDQSGIQRGDVDAFFGLFLNNLINILLVTNLCLFVLGFSTELVFQKVLPGLALGMLIGNLWFYLEARKLAKANPGTRVCALPYGVNLLPIFLFTFYVMYPAQQFALAQGMDANAANEVSWLAGIIGCVLSGSVELVSAVFAPWIRKNLPPAATLTALAAIGLLFIGADYFIRSYHYPLVGIPVLFMMIYLYAGKVRLRFGLPAGLIILILGVGLAWASHWLGLDGPVATMTIVVFEPGLYLPQFSLTDWSLLSQVWSRMDVLIPIALFSTLGSLVVVEAARASGDNFSMRGALTVNGAGSIAAGMFGSPYPTTLYVGHVAWKAVGAGPSYSIMSGLAVALLCFTGSFCRRCPDHSHRSRDGNPRVGRRLCLRPGYKRRRQTLRACRCTGPHAWRCRIFSHADVAYAHRCGHGHRSCPPDRRVYGRADQQQPVYERHLCTGKRLDDDVSARYRYCGCQH